MANKKIIKWKYLPIQQKLLWVCITKIIKSDIFVLLCKSN